MPIPLRLFLVDEICFLRRPNRVQPRFEVFSEKTNFNDNGGSVVGTRKHFLWGYKRALLVGYAKN